jgi:hypothetical protein
MDGSTRNVTFLFACIIFSFLSLAAVTVMPDKEQQQLSREIQSSTVHNDGHAHCVVDANQNRSSIPPSPFSNEHATELELDEEDTSKKGHTPTLIHQKSQSLYFTEALPSPQPMRLVSALRPSSIYLLFEVFRL